MKKLLVLLLIMSFVPLIFLVGCNTDPEQSQNLVCYVPDGAPALAIQNVASII